LSNDSGEIAWRGQVLLADDDDFPASSAQQVASSSIMKVSLRSMVVNSVVLDGNLLRQPCQIQTDPAVADADRWIARGWPNSGSDEVGAYPGFCGRLSVRVKNR